jgi:hypothetical protein
MLVILAWLHLEDPCTPLLQTQSPTIPQQKAFELNTDLGEILVPVSLRRRPGPLVHKAGTAVMGARWRSLSPMHWRELNPAIGVGNPATA